MAVELFNWYLRICDVICPKFQVFTVKFHFSKVVGLLYEHWAKNQRRENISTPIYVQGNNLYQSKVCYQEFFCILSDPDTRLRIYLCELKMKIQYEKMGSSLPYIKIHLRILSCWTIPACGLVVKASCSELDDMGFGLPVETFCCPTAFLHCTEPVNWLNTRFVLLYSV